MAPKLNTLTDDDVRNLREMYRWWQQSRAGTYTERRPHVPEELGSTPDVYIARTPSGGIPALTLAPGTGSTGADIEDEPGQAECDIYRVITSGADEILVPVESLFKTVYNLSTTAVSGQTWVKVIKDKFGTWLVDVDRGPPGTTINAQFSDASGSIGFPQSYQPTYPPLQSVGPISGIGFDPYSGFLYAGVLTPTTGWGASITVIGLANATESQRGLVGTVNQKWTGTKDFSWGVIVSGSYYDGFSTAPGTIYGSYLRLGPLSTAEHEDWDSERYTFHNAFITTTFIVSGGGPSPLVELPMMCRTGNAVVASRGTAIVPYRRALCCAQSIVVDAPVIELGV